MWIVKAFVRDKQIVDFPRDWRWLCESVGFETVQEARAMLVTALGDRDLFEPDRVRTRSRKSFFRRLSEKKGAPPIDWETVVFTRKVSP